MEITPTQQIISSCSGAILTSLVVTPLDVIKIRLQAQKTQSKCFLYCNGLMDHMCYCVNGNSVSSNVKWYKRPGQFNGTFHAMVKIAQNEGMASLWSGLSPTLVMAIPATVMYFTSYDNLRMYFTNKFAPSKQQFAPIIAGALARSSTSTFISPLELIRTKMQSQKLSHKEIVAAVQNSIKANGYRSLWIGLGPTMLRDIPFSMLYWYLYERFKSMVDISSVFGRSFVCGFSAGTIAAIATLPLDVVKTRRQITLGELEMMGVAANGRTKTWNVMKQIVQESGYRGLFVGILPRCAKVAPGCAIMIGSYELGKSFFRARNESSLNDKTKPFLSSKDL
uniref:Solute carrier family 25 member 40-like n=1 Tax=Phallusia mammillata TaxID=59560 RepID=A0A6F9DRW2_9ASCI|nr:solute carrier family 25 member 40-like [Phallusia mammillata]